VLMSEKRAEPDIKLRRGMSPKCQEQTFQRPPRSLLSYYTLGACFTVARQRNHRVVL
jgi:hypothetical protein